MIRKIGGITLFVCLILIQSCFDDQQIVPVSYVQPARLPMERIQRIVLARGDGPRDLQATLHAVLARRFTVVDVAEDDLYDAPMPHLANVAHRHKADAVLAVHINQAQVRQHFASTVYGNEGTQPYTVCERTIDTQLQVAVRIVDTRHGLLVGHVMLDGSTQQPGGEAKVDGARELTDADVQHLFSDVDVSRQMRQAQARVGEALFEQVAPHRVRRDLVFFSQPHNAQAEAALHALRRGDWQSASRILQQVVRWADANGDRTMRARAHYNLGLLLGYSGQFVAGLQELELANQLDQDRLLQNELVALRRLARDVHAGSAAGFAIVGWR